MDSFSLNEDKKNDNIMDDYGWKKVLLCGTRRIPRTPGGGSGTDLGGQGKQ